MRGLLRKRSNQLGNKSNTPLGATIHGSTLIIWRRKQNLWWNGLAWYSPYFRCHVAMVYLRFWPCLSRMMITIPPTAFSIYRSVGGAAMSQLSQRWMEQHAHPQSISFEVNLLWGVEDNMFIFNRYESREKCSSIIRCQRKNCQRPRLATAGSIHSFQLCLHTARRLPL